MDAMATGAIVRTVTGNRKYAVSECGQNRTDKRTPRDVAIMRHMTPLQRTALADYCILRPFGSRSVPYP